MIEFDVDMNYLLECDELDKVVLNDENGEHEPMEFMPIAATVGGTVWEPSKEWKAWHESLKHDNPSNVLEAVENILFDAIDFGGDMGPNGNVWSGVDEGDVLTKKCIDGWVRSIESVAATAGVDSNTGEVIRKLLDKLNTELCNAGCVIECETREERQRLIDAVKDKYAQAIAAMVGKDIERYDGSGRRETVAILQGGRKPEEMLFFREDGDVTHYLPEDATVGARTCKDLGGVGADGEAVFHCSECGCILSIFDKDGANNLCTSFIYDYPRFCPECGKRIIKEEGE